MPISLFGHTISGKIFLETAFAIPIERSNESRLGNKRITSGSKTATPRELAYTAIKESRFILFVSDTDNAGNKKSITGPYLALKFSFETESRPWKPTMSTSNRSIATLPAASPVCLRPHPEPAHRHSSNIMHNCRIPKPFI